MADSRSPLTTEDWTSFALLQSAIDTLTDPIFMKDLDHRWIIFNHAFCELMGRPREQIIGHSDPDYFPPDQVEVFWKGDDQVVASGRLFESEEQLTQSDGSLRTIWTRKFPVRDAEGRVIGSFGIITDITDFRRRQEENAQLEREVAAQFEIIETQRRMLDEISVPVIQIWESILLLPLIGVIESRRAMQVMENLLESIGRAGAQIVIIDITGVQVVDTSVAGYLIRSVQAAQLLGCQSILVGISPEIAQTLVGLGVDFGKIITRATLQDGLEYGLRRLNYDVKRNGSEPRAKSAEWNF